jgi:hypothetical protein
MPTSQNTKNRSLLSIDRPDSKYVEVQAFLHAKGYSKRKAIPKHFSEYQAAYVDVFRTGEVSLCGGDGVHDAIKKASLLYSIPACRSLLEGFLLSEEPAHSIAILIKETPEVITAYACLYFDTSVFFNDLLKVAYIRSLPSDTEEETFQKQVLTWGHYLGAKYIAWKIGSKTTSDLLPSQAVKKVLDDSIWRSSEHALEDIGSRKAKESRAWVPQVLRSAELLNNIETTAGMENALSELKIKLSSGGSPDPVEIDLSEIKG